MKNLFLLILIVILVCFYLGFIYLSIRNAWKAKQDSYRLLREAWLNLVNLQPYLEATIIRYGLSKQISFERIAPHFPTPIEETAMEQKLKEYFILQNAVKRLQQTITQDPVLQQSQPLKDLQGNLEKSLNEFDKNWYNYQGATDRYAQITSCRLGSILQQIVEKQE